MGKGQSRGRRGAALRGGPKKGKKENLPPGGGRGAGGKNPTPPPDLLNFIGQDPKTPPPLRSCRPGVLCRLRARRHRHHWNTDDHYVHRHGGGAYDRGAGPGRTHRRPAARKKAAEGGRGRPERREWPTLGPAPGRRETKIR